MTGSRFDGTVSAMIVRYRLAPCVLATVILCQTPPTLAQSPQHEERLAASFVLALGRTATPAELEQWSKQEPGAVGDLLVRHRQKLQTDPDLERLVVAKATLDALGRAPAEGDAPGLSGGTYTDAVRLHLKRLAEQPAEYEATLQRAYRAVLKRNAYSVEIDYWKRQPVVSYALLAACIEDWARRNQPGLMATAGVAAASVNSPYLATVRLSQAVAMEARRATGLGLSDSRGIAAALDRHVVAPGADRLASVGGIHFAAAGAASLAPVPGVK